MRFAVIADMHGNDVAFEAVLADIDRSNCDSIVCLGDACFFGPQPVEVLDRLRDREIPVVMGNTDPWMLSGMEIGGAVPDEGLLKMMAICEWARTQLSDSQREFIAGFLPIITIDLGNGQNLLCYHGSPTSFDDLLLPDSPHERFKELLPADEATFFCGGHTHVQFLRHLGQGFHFNPGSVGHTYRHNQEGTFKLNHFGEYAILDVDGDNVSLEFRRIPVDVERLIKVYRSSGRPYAEEVIAEYLPG